MKMMLATANDIKHYPRSLKKIHESNLYENPNHCWKICDAALSVYTRCYGDCNLCMNILIFQVYYLKVLKLWMFKMWSFGKNTLMQENNI